MSKPSALELLNIASKNGDEWMTQALSEYKKSVNFLLETSSFSALEGVDTKDISILDLPYKVISFGRKEDTSGIGIIEVCKECTVQDDALPGGYENKVVTPVVLITLVQRIVDRGKVGASGMEARFYPEYGVVSHDIGIPPFMVERAELYLKMAEAMAKLLVCSNIKVEKKTRPKKPKTRWGKPPKGVDTYHILTVDVTASEDHPEGTPKGSHTSPRQHWRRGHIRRLKDGRKVWVQPSLVGDPERGFVDKDYLVTGAHP